MKINPHLGFLVISLLLGSGLATVNGQILNTQKVESRAVPPNPKSNPGQLPPVSSPPPLNTQSTRSVTSFIEKTNDKAQDTQTAQTAVSQEQEKPKTRTLAEVIERLKAGKEEAREKADKICASGDKGLTNKGDFSPIVTSELNTKMKSEKVLIAFKDAYIDWAKAFEEDLKDSCEKGADSEVANIAAGYVFLTVGKGKELLDAWNAIKKEDEQRGSSDLMDTAHEYEDALKQHIKEKQGRIIQALKTLEVWDRWLGGSALQ